MSEHIIDPSFEDYMRNALAETVLDASPAPLPTRVRRRARVRQMVTATATGLGAVALIVGAFTFVGSVFGEEPKVNVGGRQLNASGAGGTSPCPNSPFGGGAFEHGTGDYSGVFCISQGSYEGVSWSLGVSWSRGAGDKPLCIATGTMGGGAAAVVGSSCDEYLPGQIGLNVSQIEGYPKMAAGQVPGDTETLFLEHGGDESFELQVYRAPKAFPLDLGFYLVFMPDDAQTLVAYDASGTEIARRNIDGEPGAPGEETERTRNVNIDKGTAAGVSWVLDTFGTVIDGRDTVCTAFEFTDEPAEGIEGKLENEACHKGVPDHDVIGITRWVNDDVPGVVAYSGVMSSNVDSVTLSTDDGREFDAEVITAPKNIEQRLAYFVLIVDGVDAEGQIATIVARSEGGAILAEREVCFGLKRPPCRR